MTPARALTTALVGGAITLLIVLLGQKLLFDHSGGYRVEVEFEDSAGLRANSAVKIGGVPAGRVLEVELSDDDTAIATLRLDEEAAPIGAGASAAARPVNLLGEKYVDLDVGDRSRPEPSGGWIGAERTTASVELDDLLNTLEPDVRARLRILTNEAGIAMAGRGADFNALLEELPPALDEVEKVIAGVSADTRTLSSLIKRGGRVTARLSEGRNDLGRMIERASSALTVTAERRGQLGGTVREAPEALRQLRTSMGSLGDAADQLVPVATDLERAAPSLQLTLAELPGFLDASRGTLKTALEVAPELERLGREGTPPLREFRPAAKRTKRLSRKLNPVLDTLGASSESIFSFVHGYARAQQTRDGVSHNLRLRELVNQEAVETLIDRFVLGNLPRRKIDPTEVRNPGSRRTTKPSGGGATGQGKTVPPAKKPPLDDVRKPLEDVLESLGQATGGKGSAASANDLFDYLLRP